MNHFPYARIDLNALKHNFAQARQYAPHSKIMSVIKADAYGHGIVSVARALDQSDAFAVARLSEAILLRQNHLTQPIIIFEGVSSVSEWQVAAEQKLIPVVHHQQQLDLLFKANLKQPLAMIWLMLETGMHRLGLPSVIAERMIEQLSQRPDLVEQLGLMSHFANSDLRNDKRNQQQLAIIEQMAKKKGLPICMANSAAIMSLPQSHFDWVRPGLMLYGASPFSDRGARELGLKPVMQLVSKLIATQALSVGDEVGYGGQWTADTSVRMGVVCIGYGDGYNRHLSNKASMMIRGQRIPVIGRISMDTVCVNLTGCPEAEIDDEVIIWGDELLAIEELAEHAQTIPYELMTSVTPRVMREYLDG